ncbi:hypothetical protein PESHB5_01930 [Pediococcus parvulus]
MSVIIDKRFRNLFLLSEFLKKDSKLRSIYDLLKIENDSNDIPDERMEYINRNRSDWIIQCRSEWKRNPNCFKENIKKVILRSTVSCAMLVSLPINTTL